MVLGNRHKILLGLVIFLVVLLTYRVFNPYRQQTVSRLTYGRTTKIMADTTRAADGTDAQRPTEVMTALFKDPPRVVVTTFRDPFRKAEPSAPLRVLKPVNPEPSPPPIQQSALEQAKERLKRFKVFGAFQQAERAALFLQRGKQVLVISAGDRLDGKFKIESINGYAVVVSTSDIEAPFEFVFEELAVSESDFDTRPPVSPPRTTPRPRPAVPVEAPAEELPDSMPPEDDAPSAPPSLPKPPPLDDPTPPFTSKGSPSRSYLPGQKPPESD